MMPRYVIRSKFTKVSTASSTGSCVVFNKEKYKNAGK